MRIIYFLHARSIEGFIIGSFSLHLLLPKVEKEAQFPLSLSVALFIQFPAFFNPLLCAIRFVIRATQKQSLDLHRFSFVYALSTLYYKEGKSKATIETVTR